MLKKIVPVLVLAAFVAVPVATPAFAAGDKKAEAACQKKHKGNAAAIKKCVAEATKKMKK